MGPRQICSGIIKKKSLGLEYSAWIYFLERFVKLKVVLNLTTLCLQGLVTNAGFVYETIEQSVDLLQLETLQLTISEDSHSDEDHDGPTLVNTFIWRMCKKIPKVVNLHVSYSSACMNCATKEILRAILIIPENQLISLSIRLDEPSKAGMAIRLQSAILLRQSNLVSSSYSDESIPAYDINESSIYISDLYDIFDYQVEYSILKQQCTPNFLLLEKGTLRTSKTTHNILLKRAEVVANVLRADIFFLAAPFKMPYLAEYYKHGLSVDVHKNQLLVNGQRHDLSRWKNEDQETMTWDYFKRSLPRRVDDYF